MTKEDATNADGTTSDYDVASSSLAGFSNEVIAQW